MDLTCCTQVIDRVMMDQPSAFCRRLSQAKAGQQTQLAPLWNGFVLSFHFIYDLYQHHAQGAHGANALEFHIRKLLFICLGYALRLHITFVGDEQLQKQGDSLLQRGMLLSERRLKHTTLGCI